MRITFIGGGTDFPEFFNKYEGATLSATINKFVYVLTNEQPAFVKDRFKFSYRKTESVETVEEFKHPVVRAVLEQLKWQDPLNIATMADLPGESGLGSSSAFTVALIQNLNARRGVIVNGADLAKESIYVERNLLREPGGWQDQLTSALGGMRIYLYSGDKFSFSENMLTVDNINYFSSRMILVRVPSVRRGLAPARANQSFIKRNLDSGFLRELSSKTKEVWNDLQTNKTPQNQFKVLQEAIKASWAQKKTWGQHLDSSYTSQIMDELKLVGAENMKLLGAGGGGFILVAEEPDIIQNIRKSFDTSLQVEFEMHAEPVTINHNV